jgi:hypothetical protein
MPMPMPALTGLPAGGTRRVHRHEIITDFARGTA